MTTESMTTAPTDSTAETDSTTEPTTTESTTMHPNPTATSPAGSPFKSVK